ncbi:MAG: DUF4167 domain-containing protein [Hyphomicrobium sp.]|uniref:DUF4167 domain-containing protein n=1 Tax=Hyphomicrobium sp. TaxID=82 RepID=UPI003564C5DB
MRQGQQNRRGRGRNNNNNNNRKSQNPLMRSFESSGPDVKIRGTPSHIAEKYVSLARDALSSGDPVLAENYLQHAEHYNRIILSYREQMVQQGGVDPLGNGAARTHTLAGPEGSDGDEFGDDESDEFGVQVQQQQPAGDGSQPPQQQPFAQQPRNFDNQNRYENRQPRNDRDRNDRDQRYNNNRNDRGDRQDFRGDRNDRNDRNGSAGGENRFRDDRRQYGNGGDNRSEGGGFRRRERYQDSNGADRDVGNGGFRQDAGQAPQPQAQPAAVPERAAPPPPPAVTPEQEQPAFLRRPVRRPRREEPTEVVATPPAANEDKD